MLINYSYSNKQPSVNRTAALEIATDPRNKDSSKDTAVA